MRASSNPMLLCNEYLVTSIREEETIGELRIIFEEPAVRGISRHRTHCAAVENVSDEPVRLGSSRWVRLSWTARFGTIADVRTAQTVLFEHWAGKRPTVVGPAILHHGSLLYEKNGAT